MPSLRKLLVRILLAAVCFVAAYAILREAYHWTPEQNNPFVHRHAYNSAYRHWVRPIHTIRNTTPVVGALLGLGCGILCGAPLTSLAAGAVFHGAVTVGSFTRSFESPAIAVLWLGPLIAWWIYSLPTARQQLAAKKGRLSKRRFFLGWTCLAIAIWSATLSRGGYELWFLFSLSLGGGIGILTQNLVFGLIIAGAAFLLLMPQVPL